MARLDNVRHELFAIATAKGKSRSAAYMEAGYRANTLKAAGNRGGILYRRAEVRARVSELQEGAREVAIEGVSVTREWVLDGLKENIQKSAVATPVLDKKGVPTGKFKYEPGAVNRGYELIGKELGMFADRMLFQNLDSELDGMSAEELRAFVRATASEVGLRMVDMTDDDVRDYLRAHADRVGFILIEKGGEGAGGAEDAQGGAVPALSEATDLPPTRSH